ncbi:TPA: phage tail protein [Salmonella enterica subsp. enterica serovar Muenchen]
MAQSVITSAFEHLKAQEAAGGNRIIIDQFVFANIPGLNVTDTPPESEPLPPDAQIVHRQAVDRNGVVNENTVAYSVTLPESTGDFTFNWLGLVSSATNTLCMVVYLHPQEKIKTAAGKQGNTLVYSEVMEYAGASTATGITTPVNTWQIDFTARLHGMDEATRKAALDIYGPGLFFNDAFKLTAQATGQATFAPGIAYLRGLRVELDAPGTLTYSTGISQTVYIDAALTGTLTGENKATFSLTGQKSADYIDSLGFAHYVEPVATISASGEITDIRKTRKPLNDRLDGEYLTRDGNLKEIADKGEQAKTAARGYLGLGNLAIKDSLGPEDVNALAKDQNGTDIPDKKQFARTIGAVTSTSITFNDASGWYKIATVVMPQFTSTAVIKLYGGAGFNVGMFDQAAISELVLRSGNGNPTGITATLWRRSPTAANEVAWINTSGDTYDIYINIGQYAYWLIAQYDYTGNANVTLHSTPEYSSVQPGNSTSGQTYTLYNSLMKPTAGDVEALSVNGGRLNGALGIGTDNALGGNSIVFGDNDTGFKWHSDGVLGIYANNALVGYIDNSGLHMSVDVLSNGAIRAGNAKKLSLTSNNNSALTATFNLWGDPNRPTVIELDDDQGWHLYSQRNPDGSIVFVVNGDITANTLRAGGAIYQNNGDIFGSLWGNGWLSTWIHNNVVKAFRLGPVALSGGLWRDFQLGGGQVVTGFHTDGDWEMEGGDDKVYYRPIQYLVGDTWVTAPSV